MVTIRISTALKGIEVPDGRGGVTKVDLVAGDNRVSREVAEHWYVRKFIVPGKASRFVIPRRKPMAKAAAPAEPAIEGKPEGRRRRRGRE